MDQDRRKFLKIILIGSGTLLVAGVLGPLYSWFFGNSSAQNLARTNSSKNNSLNKIKTASGDFSIVRNNEGLSIYDTAGEEIFEIDSKA